MCTKNILIKTEEKIMKKLSIVLALIMALSCFSFAAFAADEESSAAKTVDIAIKVVYLAAHPDGSYHDSSVKDNWVDSRIVTYRVKAGSTLTAKDILAIVSQAAVNEDGKPVMVLDGTEFVLNEKVFLGKVTTKEENGKTTITDVTVQNPTSMGSEVLDDPKTIYGYVCYAAEIDDVDNFAQVAASELGGYNWAGVAKANVTLINELIKGFRAAVDSVIKDTDSLGKTEKAAAVNGTTAARTSPKTGASAVAGVAVVVLALSATTAVVLRKKED